MTEGKIRSFSASSNLYPINPHTCEDNPSYEKYGYLLEDRIHRYKDNLPLGTLFRVSRRKSGKIKLTAISLN